MAGDFEVWLVDANSARPSPRILTNMPDGSCQPAWSPDGSRLAFISPCKGKQKTYPGSRIYVINADGTDLKELTNSVEGDFDPAWSPDGEMIAFTSLRSGQPAIWAINLKDNSTVKLSRSTYPDRQPAWSPDGKQIAFVRENITTQVWIMSRDGLATNKFTDSEGFNNQYPAWSPDGMMIFFSQTGQEPIIPLLKYQRFGEGAEGRIPQNPPRGKEGPYDDVIPSPDGNWLAYESWAGPSSHEIFIMNVNGADQQVLTSNKAFDFGPAWRPMPPTPAP